MDITIRAFSKRDIFRMALIEDECWEKQIKALLHSLAKDESEITLCDVAEHENEILGLVYGFALPNGTLIPDFLYVLPEYRNRGIASKLLREFELRSDCSSSMVFYNKHLRAFYQKQGYEVGENLEVSVKSM